MENITRKPQKRKKDQALAPENDAPWSPPKFPFGGALKGFNPSTGIRTLEKKSFTWSTTWPRTMYTPCTVRWMESQNLPLRVATSSSTTFIASTWLSASSQRVFRAYFALQFTLRTTSKASWRCFFSASREDSNSTIWEARVKGESLTFASPYKASTSLTLPCKSTNSFCKVKHFCSTTLHFHFQVSLSLIGLHATKTSPLT